MADVTIQETIVAKNQLADIKEEMPKVPTFKEEKPGAKVVDGKDKLADGYVSMLNGCVAWDGIEAKLPTGALMPPTIDILSLVKAVTIMDMSVDEEMRDIPPSKLTPEDHILDCKMGNKAIGRLIQTYGPDAFRFKSADGAQYSIDKWVATFGTSPFAVLAIMRLAGRQPKAFKIR